MEWKQNVQFIYSCAKCSQTQRDPRDIQDIAITPQERRENEGSIVESKGKGDTEREKSWWIEKYEKGGW